VPDQRFRQLSFCSDMARRENIGSMDQPHHREKTQPSHDQTFRWLCWTMFVKERFPPFRNQKTSFIPNWISRFWVVVFVIRPAFPVRARVELKVVRTGNPKLA
jgi:hypothetical protein